MSSSNAMSPPPVVSICCLAYNHEQFIEQALASFLGQQTEFPVEIIVHDDASTDRTAEIIREIVNRHPGRIHAILRTENQLQQGRGIMPMFADWAQGEFIAVCEGDDFWTAPDKLQTQVSYMRANPDCTACCHDSSVVDENGDTVKGSYFRPTKEKYTQAEIIGTLLSQEPTCSLLFRRSAFLPPLPGWYLRRPSDLFLDILLSEKGHLGFIDRNMAAYRIHENGIWSGCRESTRIVELILRYRILLEEPYFVEHYRELLLRKIGEFGAQLFTRADTQHEVSRLDEIVRAQSETLKSTQHERERLATREEELEEQLAQVRSEAQHHIDFLKAQIDYTVHHYEGYLTPLKQQLDQLATTAQQQANHIAVLEKERNRLTAEADSARNETARRASDSQKHIDALLAQLDQLAVTSQEQTKFIATLERERDRLTAEADSARAETARRASDSQRHIDALLAQLDQLTATAQEQAKLIATLERERDRLGAREKQLNSETSHYLDVIEEQLRYIKVLEAGRNRPASDKAKAP
jgi:glycosyltransferase involved in cell wall biosynthesis/ribosomal 50S subunit-associated protein YjgA (DUF615 family)